FSKNLKTNLRRARHRCAKEAAARFLIVTPPEEVQEKFQGFLRVDASGRKRAAGGGTAIALHADLELVYKTLLHVFAEQGGVQLHCLEVRGEIIAADFCVSDRDTLYLLKTGYDETWSRLSPGALLCDYALMHAVENP